MARITVISKNQHMPDCEVVNELIKQTTEINGVKYHYFYREIDGIEGAFYIEDDLDDIAVTDEWYRIVGTHT